MPIGDTAWPEGAPSWIDCRVDDTAVARQFYSRLFGWDIREGAGGYLMAMKSGKPTVGIGPKPAGMDVPSAWTTYFAADSADDIAGKIANAGGQVFISPFDVPNNGRMFLAADPTGAAFGVWEAKTHAGAGAYNEHGAYCWNELHTRGYGQAKEFYAKVFGWTYAEIGDGEDFAYSIFALPGGEGIGGINDDTKIPGESPAYWLTCFQVDDTDAALSKAAELGATVIEDAYDRPFGRMGIIQGPLGEVFGVMDPTKTVGAMPRSANDAELDAGMVQVFIDSDDAVEVLQFYRQVEQVLDYIGVEHRISTVTRGSVFLTIKTWFQSPNTRTEAKRRSKELVDNAEAWTNARLKRAQAEVDNLNANSLALAMQQAGDRDCAFVFGGFIALQATTAACGLVRICRPLSAKESLLIESAPELVVDPTQLLRALADLQELEATDVIEPGNG
jgi:predicted enzyme related to lactoylglutathione lyase